MNFVGVGNGLRGDDAAGLRVVTDLERRLGRARPGWVKFPHSEAPERSLSKIPISEGVIIFDAVQARLQAGGIVCATLSDTKYGFFATHNVPLRLIPGLAERQDSAFVIGIEPSSLNVHEGLTTPVQQSVNALVNELVSQLEAQR
jgi:hydrogenase maturation protease